MNRPWISAAVLLLLFALISPAVALQASTDKIEPLLLDRLSAEGTADFVVHFAEQADLSPAYAMDWDTRGGFVYESLKEVAGRTQGRANAYLEGRGLAHRTFVAGNELYVWSGDLLAANALAALPEVTYVRSTRTYTIDPIIQEAPNVPEGPDALAWGIDYVDAELFWAAWGRGGGIVVANIDTGVQWNHPALYWTYACWDDSCDPACWYDPTGDCPRGCACDDGGHGTHTMGTMTAYDDPQFPWQAGMAPDSEWIACKGCKAGGSCIEWQLDACADWILAPDNDPANRPHIVNASWGGQDCNAWYLPKVQAWRAAGIFPAFSAGNQGDFCYTLVSPGDYQESFASAAHDSSGNVASFSGRGPSCYGHDPYTKPNITAPGVQICSTVPVNDWSCNNGTDRASPHTAGAVALLWSCNPALVGQVDQTFQALQDSARPAPDGNCGAPPDGEGNYTYGYGYLNVYDAGLSFCLQPGPPVAEFSSNSPVCLGEPVVLTDESTGDPPITAWTWAFGDGYTSTLQHPTHTYALAGDYAVLLAVESPSGTAAVSHTVTVNPLPEASFDYRPPAGQPPLTVYLTNTSRYAISPTWDFGDGSGDVGDCVSHTYGMTGTYTVTLTVDSPHGCAPAQAIGQVVVFTGCVPAEILTVTAVMTGCQAAFSAELAGDPPFEYLWAFGDGMTSTGAMPTHTYGATGVYTGTLEVWNCYRTETDQQSFVVEVTCIAAFRVYLPLTFKAYTAP